jgi:hypothetical protein
MDPATGTFATMDVYQGSPFDPVSLHKYLYANANPVMFKDPSGLTTTILDTTISVNIRMTITRAQAINYAARAAIVFRILKNAFCWNALCMCDMPCCMRKDIYYILDFGDAGKIFRQPLKRFTTMQRALILGLNSLFNWGLRSDLSGTPLVYPTTTYQGNQAEVDHIYPRSMGGCNCYENAQVLSGLENAAKGNRT